MKILIIEDEPFAQQELTRMLNSLQIKFEVLAMIDTVEDAVDWLKNNPAPELIFLDIQLADGLSFDIFRQVEVQSPVIFTTAYDEYAIRAFQLNSIDYLLKPIKMGDLMKAFNKLDSMKSQMLAGEKVGLSITRKQLENLLSFGKKEYKSRFLVKIGDQLKYIPVQDVAYFYAEENVVFVITRKNDRYIIDYSIEEVDGLVDPKDFFRLNRAFVTNIDAIDKVYKHLNSRLKIELKPAIDKEILVSRAKVSEFLEWMDR